MMELGRVTEMRSSRAEKKAVVLASNSLSHRHFTTESDVPEDMSKEHITSHAMHLWDMRIIEYMRTGQAQRIIDEMPEFTEQAIAESDGGGLNMAPQYANCAVLSGDSAWIWNHHRHRECHR